MNRREWMTGAMALTAGATLANTACAQAQNVVEVDSSPWLRQLTQFQIHSDHVGDTFAIGVKTPPAWLLETLQITSDQPFELVYVLDGAIALGLAGAIADAQLVSAIRPGFPPLLLVGIDYPIGAPNARTRDYTHSDLVSPETPGETSPENTVGGADKFLRFIEDELDPIIRSRFNVKDGPAGLLGDSFGGAFSFHAFRRQSALFDRYFMGSPALFDTDVDYLAQTAGLLEGELAHDTKIFLSIGELEMNGGYDRYEEMGQNYNRLVSLFSGSRNRQLEFHSRIYRGHTHTTIIAPAFNDALLYLYGPHLPGG